MNIPEILARYDEERRTMQHPAMQREVVDGVVRHIPVVGSGGVVLYSALTPENADSVIQSQIDYFEGLGQWFEWKYCAHDTPPDLFAHLVACGFQPDEEEAILVLDINASPASLLQPVRHDIRRIENAPGLTAVTAVKDGVWGAGMSHIAADLAYELETVPERISIYVASIDGVPASSGWIRYQPGSEFASLWGGSTIPEHRNQGLYTALLAVRLQEARQRGVRYLTVDASPMSRPILEKRGFQLITTSTPCIWGTPS